MFENIMNWLVANKDSIISGIIGSGIYSGILQLLILTNKIPNALKTLMNIKGIIYLGFLIRYILPIATIITMIIDQTNEPNFKNIALFIVICVSLIFNILMSHINAIYKMFTELISKVSDGNEVHKKAINILFETTGQDERIK